jgi:hypothetical protein
MVVAVHKEKERKREAGAGEERNLNDKIHYRNWDPQ